MKITKLKEKLVPSPVYSPWPSDSTRYPDSEVGYVRMDHDGYRWWTKWFPVHEEMVSKHTAEINAVVDAFTKSFKDRAAMGKWCRSVGLLDIGDWEYNAYYVGKDGFYWIRMIDRRGDYNCYIHCYDIDTMNAKEAI